MLDFKPNTCSILPRKKRRSKVNYRRPHIRLTLTSATEISGTSKKLCAFDQLSISEQNSMRVSYFEMKVVFIQQALMSAQIDDSPITKQKNSGIELSISESLDKMQINTTQLTDIFKLIQESGFKIQSPATDPNNMDELCNRLNEMKKPVDSSKRESLLTLFLLLWFRVDVSSKRAHFQCNVWNNSRPWTDQTFVAPIKRLQLSDCCWWKDDCSV